MKLPAVLLLLAFAWAAAPARTAAAQNPAPSATSAAAAREITFTLDRQTPSPTHYEVKLNASTGQGTYWQGAAPGGLAGAGAGPAGPQAATVGPAVPIAVTPGTLAKLLAGSAAVERHRCESHNTHIAQTGTKTILLQEGDGAATCSFNYSDDERLNTAVDVFEAIAATMQYGGRLAADLRFDRLGLDAEIDRLREALRDGQASEVRNIAPTLVAIARDERVMDRVRRKATDLLSAAGIDPSQPGDPAAASAR